jgi:hypothetical protein
MKSESPKALLVDFGNHYKQLRHVAYAWRHYDLHVMCGKSVREEIDLVTDHHVVLVDDKRHELRFWQQCFSHLVRNRLKYEKLIVITAPEYSKSSTGIIVRTLWLLVCLIYINHIYIYVKNGNAYAKSILLRMSLKAARKVLFESKLQMRHFAENVGSQSRKYAVSYVYYSDLPTRKPPSESPAPCEWGRSCTEVKVGLIGAFDTKRRNYQPLIDAHDYGLLGRFRFIQVGRYVENTETRRRVEPFVTFPKDDFSISDLDTYLEGCDVLLSMNAEDFGYETHKGTAAFGEAISVRKPLVVPHFLSVHDEFHEFCRYYDDAQSLVRAIHESVDSTATGDMFARFSSKLIWTMDD